jgi:predicted nuclease of predicted toxin-antitoxin system
VKIIVDMNLSPLWVSMLTAAGYDAFHWSTLGRHDTPDALIMAYAAQNDYVVLTHDLDFGTILAATQGLKPSVIQLRADDISHHTIGADVLRALHQTAAELDAGALLTIDTNRTRLTVLPLNLTRHQKV